MDSGSSGATNSLRRHPVHNSRPVLCSRRGASCSGQGPWTTPAGNGPQLVCYPCTSARGFLESTASQSSGKDRHVPGMSEPGRRLGPNSYGWAGCSGGLTNFWRGGLGARAWERDAFNCKFTQTFLDVLGTSPKCRNHVVGHVHSVHPKNSKTCPPRKCPHRRPRLERMPHNLQHCSPVLL